MTPSLLAPPLHVVQHCLTLCRGREALLHKLYTAWALGSLPIVPQGILHLCGNLGPQPFCTCWRVPILLLLHQHTLIMVHELHRPAAFRPNGWAAASKAFHE